MMLRCSNEILHHVCGVLGCVSHCSQFEHSSGYTMQSFLTMCIIEIRDISCARVRSGFRSMPVAAQYFYKE